MSLTALDYFNRCFASFPEDIIKTREQKGQELTYVEWYNYVARAHKEFTPAGFSTEIRGVQAAGGYLYVIVRVTNLNTGQHHDGLGLAELEKSKAKGFGGAGPEAYSQALRRAFAMHGMGLEFYMDEDEQLYAMEDNENDQDDEENETRAPARRSAASRSAESDDKEAPRKERRNVAPSRDDGDEESGDDEDGDAPTEAQRDRLNYLARIFEEGGLDKSLARFRKKFERNPTRQGASIVIREMKEFLEDHDIDWREEAVSEGKAA